MAKNGNYSKKASMAEHKIKSKIDSMEDSKDYKLKNHFLSQIPYETVIFKHYIFRFYTNKLNKNSWNFVSL